MTLADFTSPDLIVPQLRGQDVAAVIEELGAVLQRKGRVPDLLSFYRAALDREFRVGTNWESGMAFPHARLTDLKELSFALGRCTESLVWGAGSKPNVKLVFLIAVPIPESTQYLSLISGLARLAKEQGLLHKLHTAEGSLEMFDVLRLVELRSAADTTKRSTVAPLSKPSTSLT